MERVIDEFSLLVQSNSNQAPETLRTTQVKVVSRWVCSVPYFIMNRITEEMICAAALGKDTCQVSNVRINSQSMTNVGSGAAAV